MLAEIPAEVDIPLPQKSMDGHGAHIIHDPMEDMFNWEDTSESSTNDTPDPLKRRLKKKKSQGGLADCYDSICLGLRPVPEPHPAQSDPRVFQPRHVVQRDVSHDPVPTHATACLHVLTPPGLKNGWTMCGPLL